MLLSLFLFYLHLVFGTTWNLYYKLSCLLHFDAGIDLYYDFYIDYYNISNNLCLLLLSKAL